MAEVGLDNIDASEKAPEEIVVFSREPQRDEWIALSDEFDKLEPRSRYRGKFALLFFKRWLDLLVSEYGAPKLGLFQELPVESRVRAAELVISNFASKCQMPVGLTQFVEAV